MNTNKVLQIRLTSDLRITWDNLCVSLDRLESLQTGEHAGDTRWKAFAFYSSLSQACEFLLARHLPELTHSTATDLESLQITLYDAVKMVKEHVASLPTNDHE